MADQRLEVLKKKTEAQYAIGSPILLEASALYLDRGTNNCIAQLKWKNIDSRPIKAVMIELVCYDTFNQKLEPVHFQYDGLLVTQGSEFGSKTPIMIKNNKVVKYDVLLKAVSFSDETIWRSEEDAIFEALPESKPQKLEGEILDQLKRDLSNQGNKNAASFSSQRAMGLWQCGCGSWQYADSQCLKCRITQKTLEEASDESVLAKHLITYKEEQERLRIEAEKKAEEARITREKAAAEEERRREEERIHREQERRAAEERALAAKKKRKKTLGTVAACLIVAAGAACAARFYFIPQSKYDQALKLMQEGKYHEAYEKFQTLGDYSDSKYRVNQVAANYCFANGAYDKVTEIYETLDSKYQDHTDDLKAVYKKAEDLLKEGKYQEASAAFASLGKYSDAASRVNEPYYVQAEALLAEKKYDAASNAFRTAGDYKDAADRVMEPYYVKAEDLLAEGKTDEASAAFAALGDYLDSVSRRWEPYANMAAQLLESGDYDSAASAYLALYERSGNTYKEAQTMAYECYYQKALDLELKGQQDSALAVYESIPNYKDSSSKQQSIHLSRGLAALETMDLKKAREEFSACGENDDAKAQILKLSNYESAVSALSKVNYSEARTAFTALGDYLDSAAQLEKCNSDEYAAAQNYLSTGSVGKAYDLFKDLGEYSDSAEQAQKLYDAYATAREHLEDENYDDAIAEFTALNDFADSQVKLKATKYKKAVSLLNDGKYDDSITIFEELGDYSDSSEKVKEARYSKAEQLLAAENKKDAEAILSLIPGFKDADEKLTTLRTELGNEALENKQYDISLSYYLGVPQTDDVKALEYKLAQTCYDDGNYEYATKAYELLGQYELSVTKLPVSRYAWANQLFETGEYAEAAKQFALLGDTTDSATRAKESIYQLGMQQLEAKSYETAKATFLSISGYNNAAEMAKECDYRTATDQMKDGKYSEAAALFAQLGEYSDSNTKRKECIYLNASTLLESKDYSGAEGQFSSILGYKDSDTLYKKSIYEQAEALKKSGKYAEAEKRYSELGEYEDSTKKTVECIRLQADALFNVGDYAGAEAVYARIKGTDDNESRYKECRLLQGKACINTKDYRGALAFVEGLDYADSETLTGQCYDALGYAARTEGNVEEAVRLYSKAVNYPGVQATLFDIGKDYASTNQTAKAIEVFWACGDYEQAKSMTKELAQLLAKNGKTAQALIAYHSLGDRETSAELVKAKGKPDVIGELSNFSIFIDGSFSNMVRYEYANVLIEIDAKNSFDIFSTIPDHLDTKSILRSNAKLQKIADDYSLEADALFNKQDYKGALELYKKVGSAGKPVLQKVKMCEFFSFIATKGRSLTFGSYPQGGKYSSATPVKWKFIGTENGNALFIAEQPLYYAEYDHDSWGVREWIQESRSMFTTQESKLVITYAVPSQETLEKYVSTNDRISEPTEYANSVRSDTSGSYKEYSLAWTSTERKSSTSSKAYVTYSLRDGKIDTWGELDFHFCYIQPVVSIKMDEDLYKLLNNGSYQFYDNGALAQFVPSEYPDIPEVDESQVANNSTEGNAAANQSADKKAPDNKSTDSAEEEPSEKPVDNQNEPEDGTRLVNGWYVSDDGKYAIKPSNLRKSYSGYSVSLQIRDEATKTIIVSDDVTINPEDSVPTLVPDKAIQDFKFEGNGKYSFSIVCDIVMNDYPRITGVTFSQGFSFTVH